MTNPVLCNRCGEEHNASLDESFARVYSCPGALKAGVCDIPPAIVLDEGGRTALEGIELDDEMALDLACALLAECDPDVLERRRRYIATAVANALDARRARKAGV